jgi:hypothetical protein
MDEAETEGQDKATFQTYEDDLEGIAAMEFNNLSNQEKTDYLDLEVIQVG